MTAQRPTLNQPLHCPKCIGIWSRQRMTIVHMVSCSRPEPDKRPVEGRVGRAFIVSLVLGRSWAAPAEGV